MTRLYVAATTPHGGAQRLHNTRMEWSRSVAPVNCLDTPRGVLAMTALADTARWLVSSAPTGTPDRARRHNAQWEASLVRARRADASMTTLDSPELTQLVLDVQPDTAAATAPQRRVDVDTFDDTAPVPRALPS